MQMDIHSGRTLPGDGEPLLRNKGVGIVLDRYATVAWKNTGETWEAASSRIVTARLQIAQRGCRRCGGTRWTYHRYLSLMSVYAPTAKAPPGIKAKFVADFQRTLDALPVGDVVLLLGDFNAHVGNNAQKMMSGGRLEVYMVLVPVMRLVNSSWSYVLLTT